MADVKWIKMDIDIFNNRKIKQIETLPDGDAIIVVWVKLLCLAGNINDSGAIYLTEEIPYTNQMLSTQFNRPLSTIQLALNTFERFGMIEIIDEILYISNWERYQNIEGMEKIREQNRIRKQKQREREKLLIEESHVMSRDSHATDKNRKEKIREDKSRKEKNIYFAGDEALNSAFEDYVIMRKQIKKPLTDKAVELAITKLKNLGNNNSETMIQILNQSVLNSWQGLFPLKENTAKQSTERDIVSEWLNA